MSEKKLKIGLGLREVFQHEILHGGHGPISWLEVITENYFRSHTKFSVSHEDFQTLLKLREKYPIFMHGIAMNLGSSNGPSEEYLDGLHDLVKLIQPEWVTDHLCWSNEAGIETFDLLPIPYTTRSLSHIANQIDRVQNRIGRIIALENISRYFDFKESVLAEVQFLNELTQTTGCKILVDINNLYVNARNGQESPEDFIRNIRAEDVIQFHVAGHYDDGKTVIDTHDQDIRPEVHELYRLALSTIGHRPTLLERDGNFPPWNKILGELEALIQTYDSVPPTDLQRAQKQTTQASPNTNTTMNVTSQKWIARYITTGDECPQDLEEHLMTISGLEINRHNFYTRSREAFFTNYSCSARYLGQEAVNTLLSSYYSTYPPFGHCIEETFEQMDCFLKHEITDPILTQLFNFDSEFMRLSLSSEMSIGFFPVESQVIKNIIQSEYTLHLADSGVTDCILLVGNNQAIDLFCCDATLYYDQLHQLAVTDTIDRLQKFLNDIGYKRRLRNE